MSSTSNQLSQSGRLLGNKPMNEVHAQGEVFKINGKTTSVKNHARWSEEHNRLISEIRSTLNDHNHLNIRDDKLRWIGGFRPSELLQVILPQLQHLCTQQQFSDILNLGQSCQQAENALAQGMVKLQQILDKATAAGDKGFQLPQQVSFIKQADHLRQEFLHRFYRLFTISQQAEFLLALEECLQNLQPRSSL